MPAKIVKFHHSGMKVAMYSVRLPNGNLLVLKRINGTGPHAWTEVAPGSSDYKRWLPVAMDEPDPRTTRA